VHKKQKKFAMVTNVLVVKRNFAPSVPLGLIKGIFGLFVPDLCITLLPV